MASVTDFTVAGWAQGLGPSAGAARSLVISHRG